MELLARTLAKAPAWPCARSGIVLLYSLELLEKPVFEDVDFVEVFDEPLVLSDVSDVANFEDSIVVELTLNTKRPGLHIRLLDVGIEGGVAGTAEGLVGLVDDGREGRR